MRHLLSAVCASGIVAIGAPAMGQLTFSETADGELSDLLGAPTALTLDVGVNTISGSVGSSAGTGATDGSDADFFTFTLGAGQSIDSVVLTRTGSGNQSFLGYLAASAFVGQTAEDIDGFALFSDGEEVVGVLPEIGAGVHAFWIQEVSSEIQYSISLNVVPEPASATALAGLGLLALGCRGRRVD